MIIITTFFVTYNTYLIDHSLQNLRFGLEAVASADTIEDSRAVGILIERVLANEVMSKAISTADLAQLELARDIVARGGHDAQLSDVKMLLGEVVKRKEKKRAKILVFLDVIYDLALKAKNKLTMALSFFKRRKVREIARVDMDMLEEAKGYEKEWQLVRAIELYEKFTVTYALYEKINSVRLRLGYCYLRQGSYQKAKDVYVRVVKDSPRSIEGMTAKRFLDEIKRMREKIEKRDSLLKKIAITKDKVELQELFYKIGMLDIEVYDFKGARYAFERVIELGPETSLSIKAKFNLAWIDKFQNRLDESMTRFTKLIKLHPETEEAINSKYEIGNILRSLGKNREAAHQFERVASECTNRLAAATVQFQAGYTYLYDLGDIINAQRAFEKLKELNPEYALSIFTGKEMPERILMLHRDSAFIYLREDKFHEAIVKFNEVFKIKPDDGRSYSGIAVANANLGKIYEAVDYAEKGVKYSPDDEYTHAILGYMYTNIGNFDEGLIELKRAIDIRENYPGVHFTMGVIYQAKSLYDQAIKSYKSAIRFRKGYVEAHNNLGNVYWVKGEYEKAINEFKLAAQYNPHDAAPHYNMGLTYRFIGNMEKARAAFQKALELNPNFDEAKRNLEEIEGETSKEKEGGD